MRRPRTSDDLEELYGRVRTPEERRATAQQLAAWAEEPEPRAEEVNPALLFVSAGEHLTAAGDLPDAVDCFRRAVEAGEYVPPDVRCYLHGGLLRVGDLDAARDLADELRRERPIDGDVYLLIGENYESVGNLRTAHRWLTMGVQRAVNEVEDGDDLDAAEDAAGLIAARLRVRRALDLPLDEYDRVVASALLATRERSS